jgi:hypothetical protein
VTEGETTSLVRYEGTVRIAVQEDVPLGRQVRGRMIAAVFHVEAKLKVETPTGAYSWRSSDHRASPCRNLRAFLLAIETGLDL